MKLAEHLDLIKTRLNGGLPSRSFRIDDRVIYKELLKIRATVLASAGPKALTPDNLTTIPCLHLIKAPVNECPCEPDAFCFVMKSKNPVEGLVSGGGGPLIAAVSTLSGKEMIPATTYQAAQYANYSKKKSRVYYYRDKHIYIVSVNMEDAIDVVAVDAVFEDPTLLVDECSDSPCYDPYEDDFPLAMEYISSVHELVYQTLVSMVGQDVTNNQLDEQRMQSQKQQQQQKQSKDEK